eukprot:g19169.t1
MNEVNGQQRATDETFNKEEPVKAQSVGSKAAKKKSEEGEPLTVIGQLDADLPAHAQKKLDETGAFQDILAFPWAVTKPGVISGTAMPAKGAGFASYLVTFSKPSKKTAEVKGRNGKKQKIAVASPTDMTNQVFLSRVWEACTENKVHLRKSVARRERPQGHEHLHCAVTAGNSNFRFRYGRIAATLRDRWGVFTNWSSCAFPAGVAYITTGSSRKWQYDYVDEPLIQYAANEQLETVEEIVVGSNLCNITSTPFTFPEFRQYIQDHKIERIDALHRATATCNRLDGYVNGDGSCKNRARNRLQAALESIRMRATEDNSLIDMLLKAEEEQKCVCEGRQDAAVRAWSKTIRWSDNHQRSEEAVAIQIIHWAITGRKAGNTLVFHGSTGTGKTWILNILKACLGDKFYTPANGDHSYPFEKLGYLFPERKMICLDEMSTARLAKWLSNNEDGWWKMDVFDDPAPVVYSSTVPMRIKPGDDEFFDDYAAQRENDQAKRRELRAHCSKRVCQGPKKAIEVCGHCFAKYIRTVNEKEGIYCTKTKRRMKTDIVCEPPVMPGAENKGETKRRGSVERAAPYGENPKPAPHFPKFGGVPQSSQFPMVNSQMPASQATPGSQFMAQSQFGAAHQAGFGQQNPFDMPTSPSDASMMAASQLDVADGAGGDDPPGGGPNGVGIIAGGDEPDFGEESDEQKLLWLQNEWIGEWKEYVYQKAEIVLWNKKRPETRPLYDMLVQKQVVWNSADQKMAHEQKKKMKDDPDALQDAHAFVKWRSYKSIQGKKMCDEVEEKVIGGPITEQTKIIGSYIRVMVEGAEWKPEQNKALKAVCEKNHFNFKFLLHLGNKWKGENYQADVVLLSDSE